MMKKTGVETAWDYLVDNQFATQEELELVTSIIGYNLETMEKVLFARTAFSSFESTKKHWGWDDEHNQRSDNEARWHLSRRGG